MATTKLCYAADGPVEEAVGEVWGEALHRRTQNAYDRGYVCPLVVRVISPESL